MKLANRGGVFEQKTRRPEIVRQVGPSSFELSRQAAVKDHDALADQKRLQGEISAHSSTAGV